ncbi:MAG TPA: AI-2E family transporter [Polyangia bacterium]
MSSALPPSNGPTMSPREAERFGSTTILMVAALGLLAVLFGPIWKPLLLALVAATAVASYHNKVAAWLGNRRMVSALIFTLVATVLILAPLTILAAEAVSQALDALAFVRKTLEQGGLRSLLRALPDTLERAIKPMVPRAAETLPASPAAAGAWAAAQMQHVLSALSEFAFDLAMMMIAFFFLLIDGKQLVGWLLTVSPMGAARTKELLDECRAVARSVIGSNLLTGMAQAATATIGYLIVQVPKPLVFGLATLLASFIPSVGTAIVALPLSALLYLSGRPLPALFLFIWSVVVVSLIDNLMRPWLIKADVAIHGAFIFFSLVGGMLVFGFVGLVVGPLALSIFTSLVRFHARDIRTRPPVRVGNGPATDAAKT